MSEKIQANAEQESNKKESKESTPEQKKEVKTLSNNMYNLITIVKNKFSKEGDKGNKKTQKIGEYNVDLVDYGNPSSKGVTFKKGEEVLDIWFETPEMVVVRYYPKNADDYKSGQDIGRADWSGAKYGDGKYENLDKIIPILSKFSLMLAKATPQ